MSRKRNRYCNINGCINFVGTKSEDFDFFRCVYRKILRKIIHRFDYEIWYENSWNKRCANDRYYFSRTPSNEPNRNAWLDSIKQHQEVVNVTGYYSICNLHFRPDCFMNKGKLVPEAKPSIFPTQNRWCSCYLC